MTVVGSSFRWARWPRWAAALLGVFGVVALGAAGIGACTSGITPDCSDAQCGSVVDAAGTDSADSGDDGTAYVSESGAETGPAEGGAGGMDADSGAAEAASGPDSSDAGGSGDTGASDAREDGPKDASADG